MLLAVLVAGSSPSRCSDAHEGKSNGIVEASKFSRRATKTGGLISAALLAIPGASAYFIGGAVVYTRRVGARAAKHPRQCAGRHTLGKRALCTVACAHCARATSWLAETGAAGPTGNRYGDALGHA
jgi:nicotinamide-nucleotide amidase